MYGYQSQTNNYFLKFDVSVQLYPSILVPDATASGCSENRHAAEGRNS